MKRIYAVILFSSILSTTLLSQQIKINIENLSENSAALFSLQGEGVVFIDSLFSEQEGKFAYNNENISTGFYQLRINGKTPIICFQ